MLFTRLYSEEELPAEFKLYLPVQQKGGHQVKDKKTLAWKDKKILAWKDKKTPQAKHKT